MVDKTSRNNAGKEGNWEKSTQISRMTAIYCPCSAPQNLVAALDSGPSTGHRAVRPPAIPSADNGHRRNRRNRQNPSVPHHHHFPILASLPTRSTAGPNLAAPRRTPRPRGRVLCSPRRNPQDSGCPARPPFPRGRFVLRGDRSGRYCAHLIKLGSVV
jgi:hypothetical protein